jgi:capsular exopolysaccharide synthesis family protein
MTDRWNTNPVDLAAVLRVIAARWRWIVGIVLLTTTFQFARVIRTDPSYTASASVLVRSISTDGTLSGVNERVDLSVLEAEARTIEGSAIKRTVSKKLGREVIAQAGADAAASVITVTATEATAAAAAQSANAVAQEYISVRRARSVADIERLTSELSAKIADFDEQIQELGDRIARADTGESVVVTDEAFKALRSQADGLVRRREVFEARIDALAIDASLKTGGAEVLTEAVAPLRSDARPVRTIAIGLLVGLLLGLAVAFVRDVLDVKVRRPEDILESAPEGPLLASLPRFSAKTLRAPTKSGVLTPIPREAVEAFRSLRAALTTVDQASGAKTIAFTSATDGAGVSTMLFYLARLFSQSGQSVLLIDANLRTPSAHSQFGLPNTLGLSTVLTGQCGIAHAAHTLGSEEDLTVLTAGPIPENAGDLIASPRSANVFAAVRSHFDVVLVDTPSIVSVADAASIAQFVDGVVLVARAGSTDTKSVRQAIEILERSSARFVGTVLTGCEQNDASGRSVSAVRKAKSVVVVSPSSARVPAWVPDDSPIWTTEPSQTPWEAEPTVSRSMSRLLMKVPDSPRTVSNVTRASFRQDHEENVG